MSYLGIALPALIAQAKSAISSSRSIDAYGRYVLTDEGGFDGMPDVRQRVLLLVSFGAGPNPPFTDDRSRNAVARNVRAALLPLSGGKEPLIEVQAVNVTRSGPGTLKREIIFRELTNDVTHTIEA